MRTQGPKSEIPKDVQSFRLGGLPKDYVKNLN